MVELILGGARSGKSRLAEQRALEWAQAQDRELIYLATAQRGDGEMARRIEQHQQRRTGRWQLLEEPENLANAIDRLQHRQACLLVDCLTLWISNCLHQGSWPLQRDGLLEQVETLSTLRLPLKLIMVSNEVGSGIVPLGQLSRNFVDASGELHQALARHCERVTLVVAGLPMELKAPEQRGSHA